MNPDPLDDLSRRLEAVRFEPRASFGAELIGRWRRGEGPVPARRPATAYLRGAAVALTLTLGVVVGLWRLVVHRRDMVTVDRCCQDIDGGGDADDGLLVVTRHGAQVNRLAVYEDRDRSHSFSAGDVVRFIRQGQPVVAGPLAGARTVELCCFDYDGDGYNDDALVIVGLPPDRITMAAIYKRSSSSRPAVLR
jgi:hypothetical protein